MSEEHESVVSSSPAVDSQAVMLPAVVAPTGTPILLPTIDPASDSAESGGSPLIVPAHPSLKHLTVSTLLSLGVVLILLVALRFLLPPMLESSRYSWQRGYLRA